MSRVLVADLVGDVIHALAQDGEVLGMMWGCERALDRGHRAGFNRVEVHRLAHDVHSDCFVCRP